MSDAISMADFRASKKDATNLTDEERKESEMDYAMDEAWTMMDLIGDKTNHNSTTLYFLWCNINRALLTHCGWTARELSRDVRDAAKEIEKDKEEE